MTVDFARASSRDVPGQDTLNARNVSNVGADPVRVLIVDDHEMVRHGLATFLGMGRDIEVVGDTGRGREAAELARRLQPDVVLMDLVMPDLDGISAIRETRAAVPNVRIIVLTSVHVDQTAIEVLQAGAIGYLIKDIGAMGLIEAVRAAHAGRITLCPEATQALVKHSTGPTNLAPGGLELTRREHEVLRLMVRGLSNPQIATQLVVTRATANFHVSRVLGKLNAKTRSMAVAFALRNGLVAA